MKNFGTHSNETDDPFSSDEDPEETDDNELCIEEDKIVPVAVKLSNDSNHAFSQTRIISLQEYITNSSSTQCSVCKISKDRTVMTMKFLQLTVCLVFWSSSIQIDTGYF